MKQNELEKSLMKLQTNPERIVKNISRILQEYPKRKVLMEFNGIFVHPFADGVPGVSDSHKITHQIVSLGKGNEEADEIYICDTHETCKCYCAYCGKKDLVITLNRFDENMNPENIRKFLKNISALRAPGIREVEHALGTPDWPGYLDLPCIDNGLLAIKALEQGGTDYMKEREEKLEIWVDGKFIPDCQPSYKDARTLIRDIEKTYS